MTRRRDWKLKSADWAGESDDVVDDGKSEETYHCVAICLQFSTHRNWTDSLGSRVQAATGEDIQ